MAKKTDTSLTIVILNYNVRQLLTDCLNSLLKAQTKSDNWKIVVVDNKSTDDSVSYIKKNFPQVSVIANSKNLGFSAGNNVALRQVKSTYTLLLNPDTFVFPQTIQTTIKYLEEHPQVAAATCRVELPNGSLDYSCHRKFPNPFNSFVYFFTGFLKKYSSYSDSQIPNQIHEIDALTGAYALVRTSVGKALNWLDEDYYWNGEDLDFCYRIKQAGWKIVYIPQVKITHFKGSSSGLWKTGKYKIAKANRIRSVNAAVDAMRIFYDKHLFKQYPLIFNYFVYAGIFLLRSVRILKVYLT